MNDLRPPERAVFLCLDDPGAKKLQCRARALDQWAPCSCEKIDLLSLWEMGVIYLKNGKLVAAFEVEFNEINILYI